MKAIKFFLVAAIFALAGSVTLAGGQGDLKAKLAKAEAIHKQAAKRGFEWTTTAGIIAKAKAAMEKGDKDAAKKFVMLAYTQAKGELAQAEDADKNWQDQIPQ